MAEHLWRALLNRYLSSNAVNLTTAIQTLEGNRQLNVALCQLKLNMSSSNALIPLWISGCMVKTQKLWKAISIFLWSVSTIQLNENQFHSTEYTKFKNIIPFTWQLPRNLYEFTTISGRQRKDTHDNVEQYDVTKEHIKLYGRMRLGDIPVQRWFYLRD